MPRRPRLSVPSIFLGSPDAFAVWDETGRLVDRNDAFLSYFSPIATDEVEPPGALPHQATAAPLSDFTLDPPPSAFAGKSSTRFVEDPLIPTRVLRLEFWPIHGEAESLIGILGRITPAEQCDLSENPDPSKLWGSALQDELVRRRARQRLQGLDSLAGHGPAHEARLKLVKAAIRAECPVVIVGETATGRHHLARMIHQGYQEARRTRSSLIPLDPASLPSELLARDFLGIEIGEVARNTSAAAPSWRVPPGSTILVESLAELDFRLQDAIVRAQGDVHLMSLAHSHAEIDQLDPWFRARAVTITIELDPLRQRIDEIPFLAQSLLDRLQAGSRQRLEGFAPEALERLKLYDWPGNWREFERVVRRILDTAQGPLVQAGDIPAEIQGAFGGAWTKPAGNAQETPGSRLEQAIQETSRATVMKALELHGSNKAAVARVLGISRPKLYRLLAEFGLESG